MINLSVLSQNLQTYLNDNSRGVNFRVFAGTGKYAEAVATDNTLVETVNCVLSIISNDMTQLANGLIFATQTCSFRVIIPLEDTEEDGGVITVTGFNDGEPIESTTQQFEGNESKIARIRSVLDGKFSATTNESMTEITGTAEEGQTPPSKTYSVSTIYTVMDDGERDVLPTIGYSYSMSSYIYYYFVENGISSRSNVISIDGVRLPFQNATQTRTPTMDGFVPADTPNGAVENISSQSQSEISLTLPLFDNDNALSDGLDYLLGGELNTAHIVIQTVGSKTTTSLMTYGQMNINSDVVKNIGMTLSLVPLAAVYELVKIPLSYHIYRYTGNIEQRVSFGNMANSPYAFRFRGRQFAAKSTTPADWYFYVSKNDIFISKIANLASGNITEIT